MKLKRQFPIFTRKSVRFNYLILIYSLGILFFTLFRLGETVAFCAMSESPDDFGGLYLKALLIGFRFDTTVSCYILSLPLLLLIIGELAHFRMKWYYGIMHYITMVLYTVCFFACAADIPYFCYFFNRLDYAALELTDSFEMAGSMILSEPKYVLYLVLFIAVAVLWWLLGQLIYKRVLLKHIDEHLPYIWSIPTALLMLGLFFWGMRGTITHKIPIRVSTAFFCNNPFLNQIGLNPVFTFLKSMEDAGKNSNSQLQLIDEDTASIVLDEWRSLPADSVLSSNPLRLPEGMNIVLVLMESMSADKTALHDSTASLTPCLDSLMACSMTFREAWSAGIHTHNGIYSTLYGHPALLARQMIKNTPIPLMCGLPQALNEAGYSTSFLLPHDEDYDNMRGFLYRNGFDYVVGEHSYPRSEVVGTWGVPDHVLFDHVLEHCDSISLRGPFFACALTCSDHGPYIIPDDIDFKSNQQDKTKRVVEYADWSIGRFMQKAAKKKWFDNTLFVFIADHGSSISPVYDMALSYNHVPLLFYAPSHIEPQAVDRLAMQIDVAPTICALLGLANNGRMLGIDLSTHSRPYAFFSADDKIGVVDGELFYLYRVKTQNASLYRYKENSKQDLLDRYPERAEAMRRHAFGLTQASQRMLLNNETHCSSRSARSAGVR